jgi:amidase
MMCGICAADVRDAERRVGKKVNRAGFDRATWLTRAIGESMTAGEFAEAVRIQQRMASDVAAFVSKYDAWLTPTLGQPPPEVGALYAKGVEATAEAVVARLQLGGFARKSGALAKFADRIFTFMPFTMLANGAGLPSMNVPLWWNRENVPIGVMLTAGFGDEAVLFRLAGQLEQARPWVNRKPPA